MRRTAEDAERTRQALLEAALMAFGEKGWRGAAFDDIAKRAGVTRGALHHHFRTKATLLEDALVWGWNEYGNYLFHDSSVKLTVLITEYVRLLREDRRFRALAACTVLVAPEALSDISGKNVALDTWRDGIVASIQDSAEAPAQLIADLALALLQGLTVTAVTRPHDLPHHDHLNTSLIALAKEVGNS